MGKSRLFTRSGIFMKNTFGRSLVDGADRNPDSFGFILSISIKSDICFFDIGFEAGIDRLIAQGFGSQNLHTFFRGLNISQTGHPLSSHVILIIP